MRLEDGHDCDRERHEQHELGRCRSGIRSLAHGISFALVLGLLLIGAALNYLPLLIHSIDISRKDSSKEEAKEELARPELVRRYTARQFVLLVPFAVAVMAVLQSRRLG